MTNTKAPEMVEHFPAERRLPSDTPIEAELRGQGTFRNMAGNFDNWRWRESGHGSIARYRVLASLSQTEG